MLLLFAIGPRNNWGIIFGIFILAFSFGIFRFQMVDISAPSVFGSQVSQKVVLSGEIIDEPSITENNQKLTVEIEKNENKTIVLL